MKQNQTESLRIIVTHQGCFHFDSAELTLSQDHGVHSITYVKEVGNGSEVVKDAEVITQSQFRSLVDSFVSIWSKPAKLSGDRSTTIYKSEVLSKLGESTTSLIFKSSEMPSFAVDEFIENTTDMKVKRELEKARQGYYNPAHEIYYEMQKVAKSLELR